ncbi:MAG: hypothetical protein IPH53_19145 [Flavobacteriales bacterium]|nr:hypothetical protein [Flavobacteriales bacterium]
MFFSTATRATLSSLSSPGFFARDGGAAATDLRPRFGTKCTGASAEINFLTSCTSSALVAWNSTPRYAPSSLMAARKTRFFNAPCFIIPLASIPRTATTLRCFDPRNSRSGSMLNQREYMPLM